ncbi:AAA family ATPase [Epilithonimonas zeae]|uniref:AAA family ATPase n=1 Tax=Epilithonimonas zeae TaxID=1416779 RepID=UPI00200C7DA8|nr:ATP-binding protein [Epilithonimonas zeae]UQB67434.1 ATP-binding protein [Epilithonimonas zeae]
MIINFSVENFGSIKEKQTLSFLANKSDHLKDYYIIEPIKDLRLNKLALIYGANASGKTTILKALDFLRKICTEPFDKKTERFDFEPFLFDENTPEQNTKFEVEFIENKIRYFYEVELNKNYIVKEKLINHNPGKAVVFERTTDEKKELTSIKFGSKIPKRKSLEDNLEIFTLWNNTVLGGSLKANIDNDNIKNLANFFSRLSMLVTSSSKLEALTSNLINSNLIKKNKFLKLLAKADFNILDLKIEDTKKENLFDKFKVDFTHKVSNKNYELSLNYESQGTQRYYSVLTYLYMLLKYNNYVMIDELESSLHPDLFNHFLLTYLVNGKKESQLIATTHNREILNNRDLFRDDAIWFTDKNEDSATELYSLADFDSSVVRDTSNVLNAYKSGKLGGVPNLGDYYIDLEDEE